MDAVGLDPEAPRVVAGLVARVVKLSGRGDGLREEDGLGARHARELGPQGRGGGGAGQALEVVEGGEERDLVPGAGEGCGVLDHHVLAGVPLPVRV